MLLIGIMIFWGVKCNKAWNKIPRYTITTGLHPYKCVIESVDNTVFTETFNIDIRGLNHKKCQFLVSIHQKKEKGLILHVLHLLIDIGKGIIGQIE